MRLLAYGLDTLQCSYYLARKHLDGLLLTVHDPLTWKLDVAKRIKAMELGEW